MAVTYIINNKNGVAVSERRDYCREIISHSLLIDLKRDPKYLDSILQCQAFEHDEDDEYDDDYYDEDDDEYRSEGTSFSDALDDTISSWGKEERDSFNLFMKSILEGQPISVEMREDGWAYFSNWPSCHFFSLVLFFVYHWWDIMHDKRFDISKPPELPLLVEILFDKNTSMSFQEELTTLFYIYTLKTKRTLTVNQYSDYVKGPAEYIYNRILDKEETGPAFKSFLERFIEQVVKNYTKTYSTYKWRYHENEHSKLADNILWEVLPEDKKEKRSAAWS